MCISAGNNAKVFKPADDNDMTIENEIQKILTQSKQR